MNQLNRRAGATALAVTIGLGGLGAVGPAAAQSPMARGTVTITATVPNNFVRNCSRITSRCTSYRQTNPPYNPKVPSVYSTKWVWSWI